jgi:hypothetical protein
VRSGTWECTKDVAVRSGSGSWSDTPREGSPKRVTLYAGRLGGRQHRSFLDFNWSWTDIGVLRKAWLVLHTSHADYVPPGTGVRVYRLSANFSEESNHTAWDRDSQTNPAYYSGTVCRGTFDPALNAESRIDVTAVVGRLLPKSKSYIGPDGKKVSGGGGETTGIVVMARDQDTTGHGIVFHSDEHATVDYHPRIEYEYDPPNYKPDRVSTISPSGTVAKFTPFTGEFTDPNGDRPGKIQVDVHRVSNGNHAWGSGEVPFDPSWTEFGGIWTWTIIPPTTASSDLKTGVQYRWRAKGWDPSGAESEWSDPWRTFTWSGTGPSLTTVPHPASIPTLQGFHFEAIWTVEAGEDIVSSRIRLRQQGDPWDFAIWDEVFMPMTVGELTYKTEANVLSPRVRREYGGPTLEAGTYVWQALVVDSQGLSAWSDERTLTLTLGSEGDNDGGGDGPPDNVTGYARARSRVRVVLKAADGGNRGPGTLVGVIEDPTNLGFRTVINAPGEVYFTLPASHPQAGVCEPWQTHYAVQQYRNGAWVDLANGWLTDFDAGENDIIIYGLDYLGALAKTIDPRAPIGVDPESDHAHGGAKYVNHTISYIIASS